MIGIREQEELLLAIGKTITQPITAYAVGGTAMMFHQLKGVTKDIDVVFQEETSRTAFAEAAKKLGYEARDAIFVYGPKPNRPIMLCRGEEERFDLFLNDVIDFTFSQSMQARAKDAYEFANLTIKIADPHDIIMMKCATDRIKDKEDAKDIIAAIRIDWQTIITEAQAQLELGRERALWDLTGFVIDLRKLKANIPEEIEKQLLKLMQQSQK